jgi:hypothetical protein
MYFRLFALKNALYLYYSNLITSVATKEGDRIPTLEINANNRLADNIWVVITILKY